MRVNNPPKKLITNYSVGLTVSIRRSRITRQLGGQHLNERRFSKPIPKSKPVRGKLDRRAVAASPLKFKFTRLYSPLTAKSAAEIRRLCVRTSISDKYCEFPVSKQFVCLKISKIASAGKRSSPARGAMDSPDPTAAVRRRYHIWA